MIAAALVLLLALPVPFDARVVAVHDGDTISVLRARRSIRLRLHAVDAPELGQPFGRAAKRGTSALVMNRVVQVVPVDTDTYGRLVARVFLGTTDVNLALVRRGLAWHYARYSTDPALAAAQLAARSEHTGLWADPGAFPPWAWRRSITP